MAGETSHGVGVFLELRKRLQTGLLVVGTNVAKSPADVVLSGGDSSLCVRTPRGDLCLSLPAGVAYESGSCLHTPVVQFSEEELHFRLRIKMDRIQQEDPASMMETLRTKETYSFHCQGCTTRLLEDRVFKRVLPLPNGNWNALVDDWCCHPDPFAKKLLPRAEDCLLGDTFVLLARDGSCDQTLIEEVSPVGAADSQDQKKPCHRLALISCASCSLVLGEAVAPGTLKLYITQVVVEPAVGDERPDASLNRSAFLETSVAARLLNLSNSLSSFHFSVQTPGGKVFLLLWLLNGDSIIASVPEKSVGDESSISPPAPPRPSLRATRALKLLYISCSSASIQQREIVTSWEANCIGHPVVLPMKACEELLQVMEESNSKLPASMRRMRSYEVAYLRLTSEGESKPFCL
ncbi:PREDICTED: E3 ubiquitin-protein ligase E3D isoform X1 [Cyprinodon variegatus]|uniref:E3 ubiquitin-protein ligase E3D n=1 Tax=Cyprinodon variegatus TaxID=28743 RepID=A0A3Q2FBV4_CYPVA|nr:PREDICTED: E3 ubiquitin-protein ligase E3D isoform X1 [Cyprinodon variegatus]